MPPTFEFQYDVFLSHSAKDQAVVQPLAERLHAKAEVRRKKAEVEFQPLASSLQSLLTGSLAQWPGVNRMPAVIHCSQWN